MFKKKLIKTGVTMMSVATLMGTVAPVSYALPTVVMAEEIVSVSQTTAYSETTMSNVGTAAKSEIIANEVSLTNLKVGSKYIVETQLFNADTMEALTGTSGSNLTAQSKFTAEETTKDVVVKLTVNSLKFSGTKVAVVTNLYEDDVKVASEDAAIISYAGLKSVSLQDSSNATTASYNDDTKLKVAYEVVNLKSDTEYEVVAVLKNGDDTAVGVASNTVTTESLTGSIEIKPNKDLSGSTVIAEVTLKESGKTTELASLSTNEVNYISSSSNVETPTGTLSIPVADSVKTTDTIKYSNLIKGNKYSAKVVFTDVTAEKELATVTKEFTASDTEGNIALEATLKTSGLEGHAITAKETIIFNDKVVYENTSKDVLYVPYITVDVIDKTTGTTNGTLSTSSTFTGTLEYKNLIEGGSYVVKARVLDSTGTVLKDAKNVEVSANSTFTATKSEGKVSLPITFDTTVLEGKSCSVEFSLYANGVVLISKESNKISFSATKTGFVDAITKSNVGVAEGKKTISSIISYQNLTPGKTYVLTTTVYNSNNKVVKTADNKDAIFESKFTPKEANGTVESTLELGDINVSGTSLYSVSVITLDKVTITTQKSDAINYPSIDGKVTSTKSLAPGKNTKVTTAVTLKNLTPDETYRIVCYMMKKVTKDSTTTVENFGVNGAMVAVDNKFKASAAEQTVTLNFDFDSTLASGEELVVYSVLYKDDNTHLIMDGSPTNADTTLTFSGEKIKDANTSVDDSGVPKTGDATPIALLATIFASGSLGTATILKKKRK